MSQPASDHKQEVQEYYGKTLSKTEDLKTNACCTTSSYPKEIKDLIKDVHPEVVEKFYGCGLTIPKLMDGLDVMDLGSGSGRDSYLISRMVGEKGSVLGIDMTEEQLAVANKHIGYHQEKYGYAKANVEFKEGDIQDLGALELAESSKDLIVSNCVINLVDDKLAVLKEAYRLLKVGGELYFSDVYADCRVPAALVNDPVLYGECLSGALYWNDFIMYAKQAGFTDPRWTEYHEITVNNEDAQTALDGIKFYSVTARLFKLPDLEPECEEYGQAVRYLGGVEGMESVFELDQGHQFAKGKMELVCGNSYRMLHETRFAPYFEFFGDFSKHYGVFPGCEGSLPFSGLNESASSCGC